jgi:hypothetical protein
VKREIRATVAEEVEHGHARSRTTVTRIRTTDKSRLDRRPGTPSDGEKNSEEENPMESVTPPNSYGLLDESSCGYFQSQ